MKKQPLVPLVYHPDYSIVWPEDHRFPMTKFQMLYNHLLSQKVVVPQQFHRPEPVSRKTLELVHEPSYLDAFFRGELTQKQIRRTGMGWYPDLVHRTHAEVGGTILTSRLALQHGLACNTAGGTHHAFPDYGSGFCFLNDLAVAAELARVSGLARKILIIDLDVHQGDGTAFIFRHQPHIFTFSMHGEKNFPFRKQQSNYDLAMPNACDDALYLETLERVLPTLFRDFTPDLVFYDAGVDPHKNDRLGKLALTDEGLLARDLMVLRYCLSNDLPVATVIGGGYAQNRADLAARHAIIIQAAQIAYAERT